MNPNVEWRRLEEAFEAARSLEGQARADFIASLASSDPDLAKDVASLIASAAEATPEFLEPVTPIGEGEHGSPAERLAGRRVGSCTLGRLLGEGGMGAVYEAVQDPFARPVAVKLLRTALASDEVRRRFEYEARLLSRLRHAGIALVHEAGAITDPASGLPLPFLVIEKIQDAAPITVHASRANLDRTARIRLFLDVCRGVSYAHGRGVIHRDIKPGNILVGADGVPKLIDFGLARMLDAADEGREFKTATGSLTGTLPYMSPEQLGGDSADVDVRADVYALGVVLYELLSGRRPHDLEGLTLEAAMRRIREEPSIPLSRNAPELRGDLEAVLAMALEREPDRRYRSVLALEEDLARYLRGEPVLARTPSIFRRASWFVRRHRAAAIVMLALSAAAIVSGIFAWRADQAREKSSRLFAEGKVFGSWVIREFQHDVEALPGSVPVRKKFIDRSLAYLDGLLAAKPDDAELLFEIAAGYEQVGRVAGGLAGSGLGDPKAARAAYEKALSIYESLDPVRWKGVRRARAVARMRLVTHDASVGDAARALPAAREVLREFEALHAERGDVNSARDLARANLEAGNVIEESGDFDGAIDAYQKGRKLYADNLDSSPDKDKARRDISQADRKIAFLALRKKDFKLAREASSRVESEARRRVAAGPDVRAKADLANALLALGDCDLVEGNAALALEHAREAIAIYTELQAHDPADMSLLDALGMAQGRVSDALRTAGDGEGALRELDAWIGILDKIPPGLASAREIRGRLVGAENARADVARELGRNAVAAASWRRAADLIVEIRKSSPGSLLTLETEAEFLAKAAESLLATINDSADPASYASLLLEVQGLYQRALHSLRAHLDSGKAADGVADKIETLEAALTSVADRLSAASRPAR